MSLDQNPENLEIIPPKILKLSDYEVTQTLGAGFHIELTFRFVR